MRKSFLLAFLLFIILSSLAYAQDGTPPPADLVDGLSGLVAAFGALAASLLMQAIKSISWLGEEDKTKLQEALTGFIAVAVSVVTGYVVALAAQGLGLIGDEALRAMIIAVLAPVLSELRYRLVKLAPETV